MASFRESAVRFSPDTTDVRVMRHPAGTGTLTAEPVSFPLSSGMTLPTALAASAVVGIIFSAAALERKDASIINREKGAGSRVLLDGHLHRIHISPSRVSCENHDENHTFQRISE